MDTDLETLATALHDIADDLLKAHPQIVPARPRTGIAPTITDAEALPLTTTPAGLPAAWTQTSPSPYPKPQRPQATNDTGHAVAVTPPTPPTAFLTPYLTELDEHSERGVLIHGKYSQP